MKLGIFDSGLGGILITKAIRRAFPDLDIMYLGDTLHLPYGNRSDEAIYSYTRACIDYMFAQDCRMIIVACNTASARALRRLQQTYLPENHPKRRILGVVVPTIEYALERGYKNLGLIGTNYTVRSNIYEEELQKINPDIHIIQKETPLLVPLIEHKGQVWMDDVLDSYIQDLAHKEIEALLLGCTHYVHLKERIRSRFPFDVISQDEIVPKKLAQYFKKHPEIYNDITRNADDSFCVTDLTDNYIESACAIYGHPLKLTRIEL